MCNKINAKTMDANSAAVLWSRRVSNDVQCMLTYTQRAKHYEHNCLIRTCVPTILCSGCIAWSTMVRFLACPFQCIINGPSYMCSNNHCTDISDKCISSTCDEFSKEVVFDSAWMSAASTYQVIAKTLESIINLHIATTYPAAKYKISDYVVKIVRQLAAENNWQELIEFSTVPIHLETEIATRVIPLLRI